MITQKAHLMVIEYQTTSGTRYPLEVGFASVPSKDIKNDQSVTNMACKEGCNLYGKSGGCPPFAPRFAVVSRERITLLYAKILTKHYPKKVLDGNYYTRWVFVETFLTSLTNKIGKSVASAVNGYFLSSGNCHACRPKKCAVKEAQPCKKPKERTFSLEATGVIVVDAMKNIFNMELHWWDRINPGYTPPYMVKVVGICHDNEVDVLGKIKEAMRMDRITVK